MFLSGRGTGQELVAPGMPMRHVVLESMSPASKPLPHHAVRPQASSLPAQAVAQGRPEKEEEEEEEIHAVQIQTDSPEMRIRAAQTRDDSGLICSAHIWFELAVRWSPHARMHPRSALCVVVPWRPMAGSDEENVCYI